MDRPALLFADNAAEFLSVRAEFLAADGYRVIPATSVEEARRILEAGVVDLAILDKRLHDDTDRDDISGLTLARETGRGIPKIILTDYPTYQDAVAALCADASGVPPAVDFLCKDEGPQVMLDAVRLHLAAFAYPDLDAHARRHYAADSLAEVARVAHHMGPQEDAERAGRTFADTGRQLLQRYTQDRREAHQLHVWGLVAAAFAILALVATFVLASLGYSDPSVLTMGANLLVAVVSALIFRRKDTVERRIAGYTPRLELYRDACAWLDVCGRLQNQREAERLRGEVIRGTFKELIRMGHAARRNSGGTT
jgi:DNA-binding response OmpR family regulator